MHVPVIASGGVGTLDHLVEGVRLLVRLEGLLVEPHLARRAEAIVGEARPLRPLLGERPRFDARRFGAGDDLGREILPKLGAGRRLVLPGEKIGELALTSLAATGEERVEPLAELGPTRVE